METRVWTLLLMITLMSGVFAQSLGTFEAGSDVTLVQSCASSTYSYITKVSLPDSSLAINGDVAMDIEGDTYSYVFNQTDQLGAYLVYGHCDESGVDTVWVYNFVVTTSGQQVSLSNSMIIFSLMGLAAIFLTISFFFREEYWMLKSFFQFLAVLAGMISVNSARIISSESNALGTMGAAGLLLMIVVMSFFFLWIFVKVFIEIIAIFKRKGELRWNYD